jgi:hypothetical protein
MLIALDKSVRNKDIDGHLRIEKSNISKATVNPYQGKEIPDYQKLDLDPERFYNLLRDPDELKKAVESFKGKPVLREHMPITAEAHRPDLAVGAIGSNVTYSHPYLVADIIIWDAKAIKAIEDGTAKELSCGYRYEPFMKSGEYEGQPYDGIMTNIQANHLALVENGRVGHDVVVADQQPKVFKKMKRDELVKNMALAKVMALDEEPSTEQIDAIIKEVDDEVPDDFEMVEGDAEAGDHAKRIKDLLAGKVDDDVVEEIIAMFPTGDEEPDEEYMEEDEEPEEPEEPEDLEGLEEDEEPDDDEKPMYAGDIKAAMDSLRREFREASIARDAVRAAVGHVDSDNPIEIYKIALDAKGVSYKGIKNIEGLKTLWKAVDNSIAVDTTPIYSANKVLKKFPGLARFSNG